MFGTQKWQYQDYPESAISHSFQEVACSQLNFDPVGLKTGIVLPVQDAARNVKVDLSGWPPTGFWGDSDRSKLKLRGQAPFREIMAHIHLTIQRGYLLYHR